MSAPKIPTDKGTEAAAAAFLKWLATEVMPGRTHLILTQRERLMTVGQEELTRLLDTYLLRDPP